MDDNLNQSEQPAGEPGAPGGAPQDDAFVAAIQAYEKAVTGGGNPEQVEAAALQVFVLAGERAAKNPPPVMAWWEEIREQEARRDWAAAEAGYRKIVEREEAGGQCLLISRAHSDLCRLFLAQGDLAKAAVAAQAAVEAVRRGDMPPLLVTALETQALCAWRSGDAVGALAVAEQAVAAVEPGPMADSLRARAWVVRARCRLAGGDVTGAERDLALAHPILVGREVSPLFAGILSHVAAWWEVTAGIRAARGDLTEASEAWEEAVKIRRHVSNLGHAAGPYTMVPLGRSLRNLGKALTAAGRSEEGKQQEREARQIWEDLRLPETGLG